MLPSRWEVGSEFDWSDDWSNGTASAAWPEPRAYFATGRGALLAIGRQLAEGSRRLHVPSFFCPEVTRAVARVFELSAYRDVPSEAVPDLGTLRPKPDDLVLAVNFFGVRAPDAWNEWKKRHPDVWLVEDHTHDPLSPWALGSEADYAFASLRKTLPLPDGAIAWSPASRRLPEPSPGPARGSTEKLEAMLLKRAYLRGEAIEKDVYRRLQVEGEHALDGDDGARATHLCRPLLGGSGVSAWRQRREANVRRFLARIATSGAPIVAPLFQEWPSGAVPFGGILVCADADLRDGLRRFLMERAVYTAVHWKREDAGDEVRSLALRILTVPLDQRYCDADVDRVAALVEDFVQHAR